MMSIRTSFKIEVFDFILNGYRSVIIGPENDLNFAEDLVFHLTSSLKITTICAHLFSLYNSDVDLWICPNQYLKSLESELCPNYSPKFELRIRYIPSNLVTKLMDIDPAAFEYYFFQIRYDFLHIPKKKFSKELNNVYGIALQDIVRVILEDKNEMNNVEERVDHYINHINKYCPQNMVKPKLLMVKNKIKQSFWRIYNPDTKINYIKFCYINQFLNNVHSFYNISSFVIGKSFHEIYEVIHSTQNNDIDKLIMYQFKEQNIYWKYMDKQDNNDWEPAFSIESISSINILSLENRKILIFLSNQPALKFIFKTLGQMKSFISLLSGYYRLIVHWNLNLCSDYYSPILNRLKKINCFGPVHDDYVKDKLKKTSDGHKNSALFLLKQSHLDFNKLQLCFEKDDDIECLDIKWKQSDENPLFIWNDFASDIEIDYSQLLIRLRNEKNLFQPILSNENELLTDLLLCCRDEVIEKMNNKVNEEIPHFIRNEQIKKSILTMQNNGVFCTRIGTVKFTGKAQEDKVFIKEFIDSKESIQMKILMKEISEWSKLKNVAIMNCKGVVMHPLSVLFEHCHITLREYYSTQEFKLNHFNLTVAAFFLAKALDYLYTNNLIHGYIKFDNLYVSYFSESSLYIKLGDPIGFFCDFNANIEQPWLPPEYFDENGFFYKKQTSYSDVWAFGTTVWEIFHKGNHPEFNYMTIDYVNLNSFADPIRMLVKKCWDKNFYNRIQPSGVFRELVLILSKLYDNRKGQKQYGDHNDIIGANHINKKSSYYKKGLINGYQKRSSMSFPSMILHHTDETNTETTLFDQIEDAFLVSESDDMLQAMNDLEYIPKENITVLNLIGEGNYGKVYQARHENKFVALKVVINNKNCSLGEEIKILTKLRHRNIVEILGFSNIELDEFFSPKESSKALVMEFMPLGSLVKFLKSKNPSDNLEMTKFATDIASGLDFLASKHIIHRDLAARNILVASENSVKIADFGLARILEDDTKYQYQSDRCLPFKWHAPESFEESLFRLESDIWSYAIVLWEMYTYCKVEPYKEIDSSKSDVQELLTFLKNGKRLEQPDNCPDCVYKLMSECWEYLPERRPNAKEVFIKIKAIDEQLRQ